MQQVSAAAALCQDQLKETDSEEFVKQEMVVLTSDRQPPISDFVSLWHARTTAQATVDSFSQALSLLQSVPPRSERRAASDIAGQTIWSKTAQTSPVRRSVGRKLHRCEFDCESIVREHTQNEPNFAYGLTQWAPHSNQDKQCNILTKSIEWT